MFPPGGASTPPELDAKPGTWPGGPRTPSARARVELGGEDPLLSTLGLPSAFPGCLPAAPGPRAPGRAAGHTGPGDRDSGSPARPFLSLQSGQGTCHLLQGGHLLPRRASSHGRFCSCLDPLLCPTGCWWRAAVWWKWTGHLRKCQGSPRRLRAGRWARGPSWGQRGDLGLCFCLCNAGGNRSGRWGHCRPRGCPGPSLPPAG